MANKTAFTGWTQNQYREYDVAFVHVWGNADTLGHTVGGEGLRGRVGTARLVRL
ncbi:hypothetical protein [Streptomyces sp. NBC_01618]|uniref:hypothetical protein n=1 Tax=Streptomyces sp. NBC_01618 TaxID=2975900 RepID=UPI0038708CF1|nr:hypothetical protein OH735_26235 [Streptomyces sp. NBC_01618]